MAALTPDFISVTYGAGGAGNVNRTAQVAAYIQNQYNVTALAHLTCLGADRNETFEILRHLQDENILNILALRGDWEAGTSRLPHPASLPDPASFPHPTTTPYPPSHFRFATDLIGDIRKQGDFCIGAACYPEGHIECDDLELDIARLRRKQEAGADFLITQLFFDNDIFYRFLDRARRGGVTLPISAGVMPILGRAQIERMIFMCGASLPSVIIKLLHKYAHNPGDLRRAGIEYATGQITELLAHGVDGIHIYTMNKPEIAESCMQSIGKT